MEYECGCYTVHTACGLTRAYTQVFNGGHFRCHTCAALFIYGGANDNYTAADSVDDSILINLRKNKTFKKDLKALRQRRAIKKTAVGIFLKRVKEEYEKFSAATDINIRSIKLSQTETRRILKQSEEYKICKKAGQGFNIALSRFKTKYNLGYKDLRVLKLEHRQRWLERWNDPTRVVERKFRVRLK